MRENKSEQSNENRLICYCFEYTREDIENDYLQHGRSKIMDSILTAKKFGRCMCALKNPKGG